MLWFFCDYLLPYSFVSGSNKIVFWQIDQRNMNGKQSNTSTDKKKQGLNTFGGVFTPSILTILGVIMYLRFGWVVGNVGLIGTLIIVTISTSITFLTSLSIASIATNQTVKTGGAYYMISRSLGIESGGAIGISLYIAQTLSVALYTLGFAESFASIFPALNETAVGLIVTLLIGIVAMISADVAIKTQFFILAAIAISLISLIFGSPLENTSIEMWGAPKSQSEGFWKVFAVFFPAVTGIMAGVNMSGDLKNPGKSIPKGTFMAVGAGYLIYMLLPIILAGRADADTLIADPLIMRKISFWGDAILLGVWGATLSSALGSILGAPRVLQALARDRVLPKFMRFLGKGEKGTDNPRIGTIFSLVIALLAVYFGKLDLIAPILTMFFLTTYGVLNISSAIENFLGNPSFRPKFKVSWVFSLLGAIGCIAVMMLINALATFVAMLFVVLVFFWIERRQLKTHWGDVRQGLWMSLVRAGLMKIKRSEDPKNWYPHLMILSGAPTKRWHLIALSNAFVRSKGLMTVASIVPSGTMNLERQQSLEKNIREFLLNKGIVGLVRVVSAPDPFEGGIRLAEVYGLGNLYPNTFVLGDTLEESHLDRYAAMVTKIHEAKRNLLIVRDNEAQNFGDFKQIDIWWAGLKGNGALMLVLGHLMSKSHDWRRAKITIKFVATETSAADDATKNLDHMIANMRIDMKKEIILANGRSFYDILQESSAQSDLVFLGLKAPDGNYREYLKTFRAKTANLPTTIYVLAGETIDFSKVLT
jgi:amino acid transporter